MLEERFCNVSHLDPWSREGQSQGDVLYGLSSLPGQIFAMFRLAVRPIRTSALEKRVLHSWIHGIWACYPSRICRAMSPNAVECARSLSRCGPGGARRRRKYVTTVAFREVRRPLQRPLWSAVDTTEGVEHWVVAT